MAFIALGINHKTASVDVRERVAFTPEQLVEALQQLCQRTSSRAGSTGPGMIGPRTTPKPLRA